MKIRVTQEHIHLGERCNPRGCPVFLAIADAGLAVACVANFSVTYYHGPGMRNVPLPRRVQNFLVRYDRGWSVAPFAFKLDLGRV